jgi:hypothetical protein
MLDKQLKGQQWERKERKEFLENKNLNIEKKPIYITML